jgi:hypothetical protein
MKILDHKDAINRRQDERLIIVLTAILIIVETAIHRVSCLNRTVLPSIRHYFKIKYLVKNYI